jgi:pentatricopeptide repeat protein
VAAKMAAMAPSTLQLNIFTWNKKLTRFLKDGQSEMVMQLFQQMQQERLSPNRFTCVLVIKAYACLGALEEGRHVHEQIMQCGCESDVCVMFSLIDMYAKRGSIKDAWRMFYKMPF